MFNGSETEKAAEQGESEGLESDNDFQPLSAREEKDLEILMQQSEDAISNAEAFAEKLARDLSMLDGVRFIDRYTNTKCRPP